jgi:hypothetical protein
MAHMVGNNQDSDTSRGVDDGVAVATELRSIARENDRVRRRSERKAQKRIDEELSYALDGLGRRRFE